MAFETGANEFRLSGRVRKARLHVSCGDSWLPRSSAARTFFRARKWISLSHSIRHTPHRLRTRLRHNHVFSRGPTRCYRRQRDADASGPDVVPVVSSTCQRSSCSMPALGFNYSISFAPLRSTGADRQPGFLGAVASSRFLALGVSCRPALGPSLCHRSDLQDFALQLMA